MVKFCKQCGKQIANHKTFCNSSCAAIFNNKERGARSEETKRKIGQTLKERAIKLNAEHAEQIKELPVVFRVCECCGNEFEVKRTTKNRLTRTKFCSEECRNKFLSDINKEMGSGGFREGSVKNYKSGWFNGIHCDSSWELAFLIWHKDHNIDVRRCDETRYYTINKEEHKFFPDFVVRDKIYEIKGINDDVNKAKQEYNPDVVFLYRDDVEKYIKYAKETYGNFIKLYDKKDK
jgi:hypothetical protein